MSDKDTIDCSSCDAECCKYIALQIDDPEDRDAFDQIRWYLRHKGVNVFVDHDDDWCVEFKADCEALGEGNVCQQYEDRPSICRDHGARTECEHHGGGEDETYKYMWRTAEQFEAWMDEQGIEWKK